MTCFPEEHRLAFLAEELGQELVAGGKICSLQR